MKQANDTTTVDFGLLRLRGEGPCIYVDLPQVGEGLEAMVPAFERLVDYLDDHCRAGVIVFSGLAGALRNDAEAPTLDLSRRWEKALTRIDRLAAVTIAAIDGPCERFNLQLSLACDYRLATDCSVFVSPEIKEGYLPGMVTFRIAKFVGVGVARRILFTGTPFEARQAYHAGLIDQICAAGELDGAVHAFVAALGSVNRVAIQLGRRLLDESFSSTHEEAMGHLLAAQHRCLGKVQPK